MSGKWQNWITPIIATIAALYDVGHLAHWFTSETVLLILTILTAISAWANPSAYEITMESPQKPQPK